MNLRNREFFYLDTKKDNRYCKVEIPAHIPEKQINRYIEVLKQKLWIGKL